MHRFCVAVVAAIAAVGINARAQIPVGTAWTYQGEVRASGAPAAGPVDLRLRLYDASSGGTQIGAQNDRPNVSLSQGRFTETLDFGSGAFGADARWLEIDLRSPAGSGAYVTLAPRQRITGAPLALHASIAASAGNATQLNGQAASFYTNAANLTGTLPGGLLGGTYSGALTFNNAGNVFTGSGAGLTMLNATNLSSGTLDALRLPVPLTLGGESATHIIQATNDSTLADTSVLHGIISSSSPGSSSAAVRGQNNGTGTSGIGVWGSQAGAGWGVLGTSLDGRGIYGLATAPAGFTYGVYGQSASTEGRGVEGHAAAATGATYGAVGSSASTAGRGVLGWAFAATGTTHGVFGQSDSTDGRGVEGYVPAASGTTFGVIGSSASPDGRGVLGWGTAATGANYGGYFQSNSTDGRGVFGWASAGTGTNYGGYFQSNSTSGSGVFGLASAGAGTSYGGYFRSNSTSGLGVFGWATAATGSADGVYGLSASTAGRGAVGWANAATGSTFGVWGQSNSTSGRGVYGFAPAAAGGTVGVFGQSNSTDGRGVEGIAPATSGINYGVVGSSASPDGRGVFGWASAITGTNYGGRFESPSTSGRAVFGWATAATGETYGGRFQSSSSEGRGVFGWASATTGTNYGGRFESSSTSGRGVFGWAAATTGTNFGVAGWTDSPAGWGVYSFGNSGSSGTKSFRIDHPADPENKYLLHYSTESPEVLNAYRGTVILDGTGGAVVELPAYFASINRSPSYTLTAVGAPMPLLHVAEEISDDALRAGEQAGPGDAVAICTFRIAGGVPGGKVSWRVEAVRNDQWMRNRASPVEADKEGHERGTYQDPEFYGQPAEKGAGYEARRPRQEGAAGIRE